MPYPVRISRALERILNKIRTGKHCSDPAGLVKKLDDFSRNALQKISDFTWTVTADGADYQERNVGCCGAKDIPDKTNQPCPDNRNHRLCNAAGTPIRKLSGSLEIGK